MVKIIGRRSDVSLYFVVQDALLYSVRDTVVISVGDVYCSIVFVIFVGVSVLSVIWSEMLMMPAMIYPL